MSADRRQPRRPTVPLQLGREAQCFVDLDYLARISVAVATVRLSTGGDFREMTAARLPMLGGC
jgi:hypothetical protein